MNDKPKRRRVRFSLRGLLLATLLIGVGMGLLVRWWTAPYAERIYYQSGVVRYERWLRRDWRGRVQFVKTIAYYSSGQKAIENVPGAGDGYWSPEGKPVSFHEADHFWHLDQGDSTRRKPEKGP